MKGGFGREARQGGDTSLPSPDPDVRAGDSPPPAHGWPPQTPGETPEARVTATPGREPGKGEVGADRDRQPTWAKADYRWPGGVGGGSDPHPGPAGGVSLPLLVDSSPARNPPQPPQPLQPRESPLQAARRGAAASAPGSAVGSEVPPPQEPPRTPPPTRPSPPSASGDPTPQRRLATPAVRDRCQRAANHVRLPSASTAAPLDSQTPDQPDILTGDALAETRRAAVRLSPV